MKLENVNRETLQYMEIVEIYQLILDNIDVFGKDEVRGFIEYLDNDSSFTLNELIRWAAAEPHV